MLTGHVMLLVCSSSGSSSNKEAICSELQQLRDKIQDGEHERWFAGVVLLENG